MDRAVFYDHKYLTHSSLLNRTARLRRKLMSETRNHIFLRQNHLQLEKIAPLSHKRTLSGSQRKKQSMLPGYYLVCNSVMDIGEFTLMVCTCE